MAGGNSVRYWRNPDLRPADDVRFWYVGKADRNGHMRRIPDRQLAVGGRPANSRRS
ncbi:hypothetical protein ACVILI_005641 [Mesorhizobium sp. USDA 4775]